jgi:hypothetical protein
MVRSKSTKNCCRKNEILKFKNQKNLKKNSADLKNGAGDEDRTRDPNLGKVMLYR